MKFFLDEFASLFTSQPEVYCQAYRPSCYLSAHRILAAGPGGQGASPVDTVHPWKGAQTVTWGLQGRGLSMQQLPFVFGCFSTQNHTAVWVGWDVKNHPVQPPAMGSDTSFRFKRFWCEVNRLVLSADFLVMFLISQTQV